MTEEMDDCFYRATQDDDVRVIVVKGEGEHFSSGHDLGTPEMNADRDAKGIPEQRNSPVMFDDRWEYDVETCQVPPPAFTPQPRSPHRHTPAGWSLMWWLPGGAQRWRDVPKPTIAMV